jgi:hypothetical protein
MVPVNLDLGHFALAALASTVIFFLQRELKRNDEVRKETLALIADCRSRLETHEGRINKHGTSQVLLEAEMNHIVKSLADLKVMYEQLAVRVQANSDEIQMHLAVSGEHKTVAEPV